MSEVEKIAKNHLSLPDRTWRDAGHVWRTSCQCTSEDHNLNFHVDVDKDNPKRVALFVNFRTYHFTHVWDTPRWSQGIRSFWKRIKSCCTLLFKGYVEMEGDFMFRDSDQIDALCDKMQEAADVSRKELHEHEVETLIDDIIEELEEK